MRISINDLLEMLAAEAQHNYEDQTGPTEEYTDEVEMETPVFDNNASAIRELFRAALDNKDFATAYSISYYANDIKLNLTPKA